MKKIIICLLSVMFVFTACSRNVDDETHTLEKTTASLYSEEKTEIFAGVWLTYTELSVKGKNYSEESFRNYIAELFDEFTAEGINNVFVHARAFADALYTSKLFPTSEYASGKRGKKAAYDILEICVSEGKKRNLKIHAWINPYRISADFEESELCDGIIKQWYTENTGEVKKIENGLYLNPSSLNAQKLIIDGVREILENYEVDGIHFDDYFYAPNCKNFDKADYEIYRKNGGALSLFDFRRENVNSLLSSVYAAVKSFGDNKIFSVSPCGDIEKNTDELYADVALWCKGGYCDMIIPQLYYGFLNETLPFEKTLEDWLSLCEDSSVKLVAGLALYKCTEQDEFAGKGKDEWLTDSSVIKRQKEMAKEKGCYGYSYFSASYLSNLKF